MLSGASQNIASGISSSPTLTRKAYTASPIRATPTKGVASGVKGAKANPVLEVSSIDPTHCLDGGLNQPLIKVT